MARRIISPTRSGKVPPPGIAISDADRAELQADVDKLGQEIATLRTDLKGKPMLNLLPDVQIFPNAVRSALTYNEFYNTNQVKIARQLIQQGFDRVRSLREGKEPMPNAKGLIVRGYLSRVDGSAQPYGLVVPATYAPGSKEPRRLDFWFHGRGETLTELDFINGRQNSPGEFTPSNAFVLHLYGRYCNGSRFAGETDFFEALEHVKQHYPIDTNRMVVRGFSLGGAACWHMTTHHAGLWAAAAPGAGFSETEDFLKTFQKETLNPTPYERKLWHLYDSTDHALNLFNVPTIAYSGEIDSQKQAADIMVKAAAAEGLKFPYIIGPNTPHRYHPQSKIEINKLVDEAAAKGRNPVPEKVKLVTYSLRYNEMFWLRIEGMEEHWEQARVEAQFDKVANTITVTTKNVSAISFEFPKGQGPLDQKRELKLVLNGQKLEPVLESMLGIYVRVPIDGYIFRRTARSGNQ